MSRRQGADSPAAEHVRSKEPVDDTRNAHIIDDSSRQTMPDIGGDTSRKPFVCIQSERVKSFLLHPPVAIEATLELERRIPQCTRLSLSAAKPVQDCHDLLCGIPVALELTGAEWVRHGPTVLVHNCVAAVLPSLILGPVLRPGEILEVSVTVTVALPE